MKKSTFILASLGGLALGATALYYIGKKENEKKQEEEKATFVTLDSSHYVTQQQTKLNNEVVNDKNSLLYQDETLKNQQVKQQVAALQESDDVDVPLYSDDALYDSQKELPRRSTLQVENKINKEDNRISKDNQNWIMNMLNNNDQIIGQLASLYPYLTRNFILRAITYCQTIVHDYSDKDYLTIIYKFYFDKELDYIMFQEDMYQSNYIVKPLQTPKQYCIEILEPLKYTKIMADLLSMANACYLRSGKMIEFGVRVDD